MDRRTLRMAMEEVVKSMTGEKPIKPVVITPANRKGWEDGANLVHECPFEENTQDATDWQFSHDLATSTYGKE